MQKVCSVKGCCCEFNASECGGWRLCSVMLLAHVAGVSSFQAVCVPHRHMGRASAHVAWSVNGTAQSIADDRQVSINDIK